MSSIAYTCPPQRASSTGMPACSFIVIPFSGISSRPASRTSAMRRLPTGEPISEWKLHPASRRAASLPEGETDPAIRTQTEEDQQMDRKQVEELLYQALETELGGVQVYKTAIRCAENDELKEEWEKYGEQTKRHVKIVEGIFERFGLDTKK